MPASSTTVLDQIARFFILLSGAPAYWCTIDTSCDHALQLSKWLGIDGDDYKKLLIATNLAQYKGNAFCIAGDEWKSFLMEHHLFVHPLVVMSSCRLVVSSSCRLVVLSSCCLVVLLSCRLVVLSSCRLVVLSSCPLVVLSSRRPLTVPPSRHLIVQAGCCVTSHCCLGRNVANMSCHVGTT